MASLVAQCSCLENPRDGGAWWAAVYGVTQSQTRLKRLSSSSSSWWLSGKESACQYRRHRFSPWVGIIPWRRTWKPTSVFLPGKLHGQRSLAHYSPWGHKRVRHDLVTKQQQCLLPPCVSTVSPTISHEVTGPDAMIFVF